MKVEMRWLQVEMHNKKIGAFTERHLQFRQLQSGVDASGCFSAVGNTWSEWQDVPTVSDGDNDA